MAVAMWLCGYGCMAVWLYGCVAIWLCGWVVGWLGGYIARAFGVRAAVWLDGCGLLLLLMLLF